MYIHCKKDFNKVIFDMKKGINYPVTNITDFSIYFVYPNGEGKSISKSYLEENNEYLEFRKEKLCKHTEDIYIYYGMIICKECDELMKWVSHYDFMDKYINEFYKEILKDKFLLRSYEGFVSAHGDKFYSNNSDYKERNIGFGVGVMISMIISYIKPYREEYEQNHFDYDWQWQKFDEIVLENKSIVDKYNKLWIDYEKSGKLN